MCEEKSVNKSNGVNSSYGVNSSEGVNSSYGVNSSEGVNWSKGVNSSEGVNNSYSVNWSNGVNNSNVVNNSYGVNSSEGVNSSYGVINSFGVDSAIFLAEKEREYTVFGQNVTEERFNEIWSDLSDKLNGWYPKFNNAFELYIKNGNDWTKINASEIGDKLKDSKKPFEAWKDMPHEAIEYLKELPEFNSDIFKKVTGIDVTKSDKVEIKVEGKSKWISRESAKELNLI